MLSKGQGNTVRTYEQFVCALEKDNRAEEAHKIWQKKIAHDLHSVPWRFCHLMLGIYYRNNKLERLVKVCTLTPSLLIQFRLWFTCFHMTTQLIRLNSPAFLMV
jgi:hypothetical protein